MKRTYTTSRPLCPFHNPHDMALGQGGVIDWSKVSSFFNLGKFTVKVNGAVAKAAVAITVDALSADVPQETVIDFGAEDGVTVTTTATKAIGQTSIAVVALTAPIPSGSILDFGTSKEVQTTADAILGATTISVVALDTALGSGDVATYQGGRKLAKVKALALAGATSLTVEPLQFAIADNTEGLVDASGSSDGKMLPQGTVVFRNSVGFVPRRDRTGVEEAVGFLVSDAYENSPSESLSGYGLVIGNTMVYENCLPDSDSAGDLPTAYKTELQANTLGFVFTDLDDSRIT